MCIIAPECAPSERAYSVMYRISKYVQPINIRIYYWDKCNGVHLEHVKKKTSFELDIKLMCSVVFFIYFSFFNRLSGHAIFWVSCLSNKSSVGCIYFKTVLNDSVCKIFSLLSKALWSSINRCYSIPFSNLKQENTVICSHMGSMYIETLCIL